jgi:hypothetical protein
MKTIFLLITSVVISYHSFSQNQNSIIKTQAMEMARSLIKKDYPAFIKYMHPQVIELAGGNDKLIARMDTMNSVAAQYGAEIKRVVIGNPGAIVKHNNELQVTIPQITEMKTGFGNLVLESTLIAISNNKGKDWYFIDTSVYNVDNVRKALPNLSPSLVIPPAKPPKFTPAQ